ncbi:MAG: glycosyltransferase, partial [Thermoplasmata archaeon]
DNYILIRIGQKIEGIDRQYNFMNLPENEKYYFIKSMDLMILPSLNEGFGLPVVEAISQKIPVITSFMRVINEISGEIPQLYTNSLNPENWIKFITKREYENMNMERAYSDIQKFIDKNKYIEYHRENLEKLREKFKNIEYDITLW